MTVNFIELRDAIKADIAAFDGTQTDLSREVCGSAQGLRHKVAEWRGSCLRPQELVRLQQLSGSRHTVQEMSRQLGGVFVALPPPAANNREQGAISVSLALAELFQAMLAVPAGAVSAAERIRLERLAFAVVAAVFEWLFGCVGANNG